MAKGKHAIALFEVIQSSKTSRRSVSDALRTPKWWFKRNKREGPGSGEVAAGTTPASDDPTIGGLVRRSEGTQSQEPSQPQQEHRGAEEQHGPATSLPQPPRQHLPTGPVPVPALFTPEDSSAPAPRTPGIDLKLDPDRQRISFHFTYTSALVTCFAVLVVVVLAYVVGVKMSGGPAPAVAGASTAQLREGPARPDVLNVKPAAGGAAAPAANGISGAQGTTTAQGGQQQGNSATAPPRPLEPAPGTTGGAASGAVASEESTGQRIIGRNYVVVQIYPDEKSANEARDLLAGNGIACTIEQGLAGYAAKSWYCVVGLTGFDRIRDNPDFARYEKSIRDLSLKFAGNSKFKKFDPQAYRWKG
jgi:hypothetical protein